MLGRKNIISDMRTLLYDKKKTNTEVFIYPLTLPPPYYLYHHSCYKIELGMLENQKIWNTCRSPGIICDI